MERDGAAAAEITSWRDDTPGCATRIHLNNAGAALMPASVLRVIHAHLDLEARIGGYEAADEVDDRIRAGYADLAAVIGAAPRNIAVVANATAGFVQALSSFDLSERSVLVTSRCDYTSNQIQYLSLRQRLGVALVHAEDLPEGGVDPDSVRTAIRAAFDSGRKPLVALSWIPTNSGLVQDAGAVGAICHEFGVPFVLDACQAVGQLPIDVSRLRCDYLATTARKFLRGPRGIGFLYASDAALGRGDCPLYVDMRGATWTGERTFAPEPTARRYEGWELPYALVLGQSEAARYARGVGIETASRRAWALAERLRAGLRAIPGARVLDRGTTRCAIVTVAFERATAHALVRSLVGRGINCVTSLLEYSRYDFTDKAVDAAIRLSPHYYNTEAEIDATLAALEEESR